LNAEMSAAVIDDMLMQRKDKGLMENEQSRKTLGHASLLSHNIWYLKFWIQKFPLDQYIKMILAFY
jgi:hypothetical protein